MQNDGIDVGRVFIEYIVLNKAKNERIPLEGFAWEDALTDGRDRNDPGGHLLPLKLWTRDRQYVEHFLEEEIRDCLRKPACFSSVERKLSYLFARIRRDGEPASSPAARGGRRPPDGRPACPVPLSRASSKP